MFLKNYYVFLGYDILGKGTIVDRNGSAQSPSISAIDLADTADAGVSPSLYRIATTTSNSSTSSKCTGVAFGTGNTPVTLNDYKLSGTHLTKISATANVSITTDNNGITATGIYTVTNTDSKEITIKEVGLFAKYKNSSGTINYGTLVERTVLDNPVTIPAGGVGQVTYTIRMNYPTT